MVVTAAYGISWAYLIGDVSFTTYKSSQLGPSPLEAAHMTEPTRLAMVAVKRSVFQGVASMALPAFTIHTAVRYAGKAVRNSTNVTLKRWGPTAVGISIVPALPYLFDEPVSGTRAPKTCTSFRGPHSADSYRWKRWLTSPLRRSRRTSSTGPMGVMRLSLRKSSRRRDHVDGSPGRRMFK